MADQDRKAWKTSSGGYVTFDTSVSSAAVKVARDPYTSDNERRDYAKRVNKSAQSTYDNIRNSRKVG